MSAPPEAPLASAATAPASWSRDLALITAIATIAYLAIGWHPVIGSAMRYAESAREMARSGDWVVPTLNFVPYFEKPILTYWAGAATQTLFGSSPSAVQLPSLLAGLLSLFATYAFGRHWRDARFGFAAALLLLFSGQFLVFTTVFSTDPLLAGFLFLAWYAYWRHEQSPALSWWQQRASQQGFLWLFWMALSAAILTKGPLAIVLSGLAIGGFALVRGGALGVWRTLLRLRPLAGVAIIALVCLPWHLLAWKRDPRFLEFFYVHINWEAFFDGNINHPGPPWYYLPILAAALAPWSLIAVPLLVMALARSWQAVVAHWRGRGTAAEAEAEAEAEVEAASAAAAGGAGAPPAVDLPAPTAEGESPARYRDGQLFLASVVIFPLLFLSVSASKLATYAMPLYPALALLVLDQLTRLERQPPAWLRLGLLVQVGLLIIAAAVYLLAIAGHEAFMQVDWDYWPLLALGGGAVIAGGIWGGLAASSGRVRRGMVIVGISTALAISACLPNAFRMLKYIDARALARTVAAHRLEGDQLLLTPPCVHDHSIVWELAQPLSFVDHPRELGMGLYTSATPPGSPWPVEHDADGKEVLDPRTGKPRRVNLYQLSRRDAPNQQRLWPMDELISRWPGPARVWLFADNWYITPLLSGHCTVYEVGRTDKITLVTNLPLPGVTGEPLTTYRHGLP
jgi:4-amino-4-deoxy-L-arabinose transferase-like glycosyltransferase